MCGIAGVINKDVPAAAMQQAMNAMAHRGPDGSGMYSDAPLLLGHVRLAIQDLTDKAAQPMVSADGRYIIVYNGELYNHPQLRQRLEQLGVGFSSASDTETLLQAYIHWGEAVLPELNGIFAFAVYDREQRSLFIARDAFGVKPLYYYHHKSVFLFASEIKAMLPLGDWDRSIDAAAFQQTLLLQWHLADHTGFTHIKKLLPGHCMQVFVDDPASLQIRKWYRFPSTGVYDQRTEPEWINLLDTKLRAAVQRQLLSDKPVAAFLSGGLDSGLLVAIAQQLQPGYPMPCFTIDAGDAFRKEGFAADLPYAHKLADTLKVPLHVFSARPGVLQHLDQMIWQLDEAQADIAPLFVGMIAGTARAAGYEVMIGGVGGDDLFSGYRRHQALAMEPTINAMPDLLKRGMQRFSGLLPDSTRTRRLKKMSQGLTTDPMDRIAGYFRWTGNAAALSLMAPAQRLLLPRDPVRAYLECLNAEIPNVTNVLDRVLYYELNSFLPSHNLNYTDKMGMAQGVEIRVPYLDLELAELTSRIPPSLKMKGTETKYLLKKVAERYLPKEVIYRSKTGFGAPLRSWIQEDTAFRAMILERLTDTSFLAKGIFDGAAIERLIKQTFSGQHDGSYTILALLSAESWLRQFA